jgi:hypothetical protein
MMVIINVVVNPLQAILNPIYLSKLIARSRIQSRLDTTSQDEVNKLFEGQNLFLFEKYAFMLRILWLSGFYGPLVPHVFVVAFLGLTLSYWTEKVRTLPNLE